MDRGLASIAGHGEDRRMICRKAFLERLPTCVQTCGGLCGTGLVFMDVRSSNVLAPKEKQATWLCVEHLRTGALEAYPGVLKMFPKKIFQHS